MNKLNLSEAQTFRSAQALSDTKENCISGVVSVTGAINSNNVLFYPGAHRAALASFMKRGFISDGHNWGCAVAMPTSIKEDGQTLLGEAEFHSTDDAQCLRVKCQERFAKGLFVGFSTGVQVKPGEWAWFEDGQTCWDHAKGYGVDMSLMDPNIKKAEDFYAVFQVGELVEWSIVTIPAVRNAGATAVSSLGAHDTLTFDEELSQALDTVQRLISRVEEIDAMRKDQGRTLSAARIEAVGEVKSAFDALAQKISETPRPAEEIEAESAQAFKLLDLRLRLQKLQGGARC